MSKLPTNEDGEEVCPNKDCRSTNIVHQGGCWTCLDCGNSGCG